MGEGGGEELTKGGGVGERGELLEECSKRFCKLTFFFAPALRGEFWKPGETREGEEGPGEADRGLRGEGGPGEAERGGWRGEGGPGEADRGLRGEREPPRGGTGGGAFLFFSSPRRFMASSTWPRRRVAW